MQTSLITETDYTAIRALIAPDITETHLSDAYLSQLPFVPDAEKTVRRQLTPHGINIDALPTDSLEDVRLAIMHTCAATLCLTAPQLLRQSALQVNTEVQRIDWQQKREFHLTHAQTKISEVIQTATHHPTPTNKKRRLPFGAVGTKRNAL